MTEEDDKLVTLKFAIDMRKATRAATIEECAKVAESFISNEGGTEFDGGYEHGRRQVAEEIRSLHHSHPGLKRERE